jgi:hypothetical protein
MAPYISICLTSHSTDAESNVKVLKHEIMYNVIILKSESSQTF